jgi:hypothetical protein
MIAADTLLRTFAESLAGKDKSEIILLADREATRAYRNSLRCGSEHHPQSRDWCEYSRALTRLIYFLRNEVKVDKPNHPTRPLFRSIQKGARQEDRNRHLQSANHPRVQ